MSTQPPQIEYAKPLPWHRRRRSQRSIMIGVVAIGLAIGGYLWGPALWRHAQLLYWQRRCLASPVAPEQIVTDTSSKLSVISPSWSQFYSLYSPPGFISDGTVYLGESITQKGDRVLVGVDVAIVRDRMLVIKMRTFRPGHLFLPSMELGTEEFNLGVNPPVIVYSATVDPNDPTHISFRVIEKGGRASTIDGWIHSRGGQLEYRIVP